jgi:hypothetical protein
MFDELYIIFANYFVEAKQKGRNGYWLISTHVALDLLGRLYNKFVIEGVKPIEQLPEDKKRFYFQIAKQFYTEKEKQIFASKAAYALDRLTENL